MTQTDIPYESLGYRDLKRHPRSIIEFNCDVETRGQQATACFFFIVKSDIEIFVWSVAETTISLYVGRGDHRSSEVVSVTAAPYLSGHPERNTEIS